MCEAFTRRLVSGRVLNDGVTVGEDLARMATVPSSVLPGLRVPSTFQPPRGCHRQRPAGSGLRNLRRLLLARDQEVGGPRWPPKETSLSEMWPQPGKMRHRQGLENWGARPSAGTQLYRKAGRGEGQGQVLSPSPVQSPDPVPKPQLPLPISKGRKASLRLGEVGLCLWGEGSQDG